MRSVVRASLLIACAAGCGDSWVPLADAQVPDAPSDAAPAPGAPMLVTPGRSVARVAVDPAHPTRVVMLEETVAGFERYAPGPSRVRAVDQPALPRGQAPVVDRVTSIEAIWEPPAPARIADIAVHPSGEVTVALVDDDRRITLVRLGADLIPTATTPLVDPEIVNDPPLGSTAFVELLANGFTGASVRLAAAGEDAVVAVFTGFNSLIAYRLAIAGGAFTTSWRSLVEPASGAEPFLPIGGSFDTFGAIVAWFHPSLAVDRSGNAYLAVWAGESRIRAHNVLLGGTLSRLFTGFGNNDSDVLLTKLDGAGQHQWVTVVGARYEDEPYALAANDDEVVIVGRSRRNPGFDNSQWDPWLAAVDGAGHTLVSRTLPFNNLGILLAADLDDGGRIVAGGSDGWSQNPEGLSILSDGTKLLFTLADLRAEPVRIALEAGPRHNEIRSVAVAADGLWFAGHQDGPLTHSGDGDPSQIHATGVAGTVAR
jgi:hypothetical protein